MIAAAAYDMGRTWPLAISKPIDGLERFGLSGRQRHLQP